MTAGRPRFSIGIGEIRTADWGVSKGGRKGRSDALVTSRSIQATTSETMSSPPTAVDKVTMASCPSESGYVRSPLLPNRPQSLRRAKARLRATTYKTMSLPPMVARGLSHGQKGTDGGYPLPALPSSYAVGSSSYSPLACVRTKTSLVSRVSAEFTRPPKIVIRLLAAL